MNSDTLLICGIGLIIAGVLMLRISWTSLTFQENEENEYDFHDLAFYGGNLCAIKNFLHGLASLLNGKHRALRVPSLFMLLGIATLVSGGYLLLL